MLHKLRPRKQNTRVAEGTRKLLRKGVVKTSAEAKTTRGGRTAEGTKFASSTTSYENMPAEARGAHRGRTAEAIIYAT